MARHAICNQDGLVINVIEWDGAEWLPPKNCYVVFSPVCDIGDSYDLEKDEFIRADRISKDSDQMPKQITLQDLQDQLNELKKSLAA